MWIELQQSLWTHRKTFALAEALSIDEVHAGGLVARLWCWALDNARPDFDGCRGLLSGVVPLAIAGGAGWKGEPSLFFYALIDAGFLEHDGDDIVIHDWWDYSGRLLERRRRDRERKQQARAALAAKAARKTGTRHKARPQDTPRTSHLTLEKVTAENIVTVPTLLTESLNSTEINTPPTPPADAGGDSARDEAPTELRSVPKPWERDLADAEQDPLFEPIAEIDGRPMTRAAAGRVVEQLGALRNAGASPDEVRRRAANYRLIMSPGIPLTIKALLDHWEHCSRPPEPPESAIDERADWGRALNEARRAIHGDDRRALEEGEDPVASARQTFDVPPPDPGEIAYTRPEWAAPGQYAHPLVFGRRGKPGEVRHDLGRRWEYEAAAPGWRRLD